MTWLAFLEFGKCFPFMLLSLQSFFRGSAILCFRPFESRWNMNWNWIIHILLLCWLFAYRLPLIKSSMEWNRNTQTFSFFLILTGGRNWPHYCVFRILSFLDRLWSRDARYARHARHVKPRKQRVHLLWIQLIDCVVVRNTEPTNRSTTWKCSASVRYTNSISNTVDVSPKQIKCCHFGDYQSPFLALSLLMKDDEGTSCKKNLATTYIGKCVQSK